MSKRSGDKSTYLLKHDVQLNQKKLLQSKKTVFAVDIIISSNKSREENQQ